MCQVRSPIQGWFGRPHRLLSPYAGGFPERHGDLHTLPFRPFPWTGIHKMVILCCGRLVFICFFLKGRWCRAGDLFQRGPSGRLESNEPKPPSSRAKLFGSTSATRDHQHDASASAYTMSLETFVGGPLREMPMWTVVGRASTDVWPESLRITRAALHPMFELYFFPVSQSPLLRARGPLQFSSGQQVADQTESRIVRARASHVCSRRGVPFLR